MVLFKSRFYWQRSTYHYQSIGCDSHCNSNLAYCLVVNTIGIILVIISLNRHNPFDRVPVDYTYWHFIVKCVAMIKSIWYPYDFPVVTTRRHSPLSLIALAITVTSLWAWWRLKSPGLRMFTQLFIQAQIKDNIKAPHHWPSWGEFNGDRWILRTKGQ